MATTGTYPAFDGLHPVVPAAYFCGVIMVTMLAFQPVCVGISLAGALACSLAQRGCASTLRGLRWQLPVALLVALANPLFSASGSTLLLRLGPVAVYAESLAYGACMGSVLVAAVLWFEDASRSLTSDKLMALTGGVWPTVTLMASMTARLVPELVRRGREVSGAESACTAARPSTAAGRASSRIRTSGVLMGWSLEDSLVTADSMRARGWGAAERRTSYRLYRFADRDSAALVGVVTLVAAAGVAAWIASSGFRFYPVETALSPWWGYAPVAALAFLPSALALGGRLGWRG